jgi:hypothetical protein
LLTARVLSPFTLSSKALLHRFADQPADSFDYHQLKAATRQLKWEESNTIPRTSQSRLQSRRGRLSNSLPAPALLPRSVTPTAEGRFLAERGITFHDDEADDNYEYIRLPKKRDFDIITAAHSDPTARTTSNLPLIATRYPDKAQVTLWAKLDTGADVNVINRSTIKSLLGDKFRSAIHPLTVDERDFVMLGDTRLHPTHYVLLTFQAGRSKTTFEKEKFYVVHDTWGDSDTDGVPNVVLGWTFLLKNHVVLIDVRDFQTNSA